MTTTTADQLRVAIIGCGPSGFFAADALTKANVPVKIDLFDRLPTPFGLVRFGVAPDHPKIKTVTKAWEKTAQHPAVSFFGNVEIGRDLPLDELRQHYDAVLFTSGAETDRKMDIPGEDLPGSHPATQFVGWYNGHPDYADRRYGLDAEAAVVIGQGNVAMDVARMLAKTVAEIQPTDTAAHALSAFATSKVKDVFIIGRRGPAQAKFTTPELRELCELAEADFIVNESDLALSAVDEEELKDPDNATAAKNVELLREHLKTHPPGSGTKPRRVHLLFRLSPIKIEEKGGRVGAIVLEKNRLEGKANSQKAVGTGETITIPCGLVFRSVGYKGKQIPGVPFDAKSGTIPNVAGRVTVDGKQVPGLYTAGWIKRGPSGVIGTNKACAVETVNHLLADRESLPKAQGRDSAAVSALLSARGVKVISFADWQKIDAAEIERGKAKGKARDKVATWAELLEAAGK
ncbi:MAG: NADP oxidoreductase [Deltaproteobacteria bacterium RBG_16_71_12]|nr:MAG: NADP oxidoreductase [Deltaproteobacteria bacterium RBG_16_71_12]